MILVCFKNIFICMSAHQSIVYVHDVRILPAPPAPPPSLRPSSPCHSSYLYVVVSIGVAAIVSS